MDTHKHRHRRIGYHYFTAYIVLRTY